MAVFFMTFVELYSLFYSLLMARIGRCRAGFGLLGDIDNPIIVVELSILALREYAT